MSRLELYGMQIAVLLTLYNWINVTQKIFLKQFTALNILDLMPSSGNIDPCSHHVNNISICTRAMTILYLMNDGCCLNSQSQNKIRH